jgi:hypothetical protein
VSIALLWLRRDLRLADHPALYAALEAADCARSSLALRREASGWTASGVSPAAPHDHTAAAGDPNAAGELNANACLPAPATE